MEQVAVPYPANMDMRCLNEIAHRNLTSEKAKELWTFDQAGVACDVIGRMDEGGGILYKVELAYTTNEDEETEQEIVEWIESEGVVREAITFLEKPYQSDQFLQEAFRHPIGIPDDIFPDSWRDYNYY
jgi:hypothetical protein